MQLHEKEGLADLGGVSVGEQFQAAVTPEEEAVIDEFCIHCQHSHSHEKGVLLSL